MARKRITLDQLKPREYEFEVNMPDGEVVVFNMRAPSQAEMWQIEVDEAMPKQDQFIDRKNPFLKAADGEIKPVIDEKAYNAAIEDRGRRIMYRKSLAAWADADQLFKGKNEEERIAELADLGSWVISALWKMTQSLVVTTSDAISARKFRGS